MQSSIFPFFHFTIALSSFPGDSIHGEGEEPIGFQYPKGVRENNVQRAQVLEGLCGDDEVELLLVRSFQVRPDVLPRVCFRHYDNTLPAVSRVVWRRRGGYLLKRLVRNSSHICCVALCEC